MYCCEEQRRATRDSTQLLLIPDHDDIDNNSVSIMLEYGWDRIEVKMDKGAMLMDWIDRQSQNTSNLYSWNVVVHAYRYKIKYKGGSNKIKEKRYNDTLFYTVSCLVNEWAHNTWKPTRLNYERDMYEWKEAAEVLEQTVESEIEKYLVNPTEMREMFNDPRTPMHSHPIIQIVSCVMSLQGIIDNAEKRYMETLDEPALTKFKGCGGLE